MKKTLRDALRAEIERHQFVPFIKTGIPVFDEFDRSSEPYLRCEGCRYETSDNRAYKIEPVCPQKQTLERILALPD